MVTEMTPGMLVGRYRLKEPIADGGMGSVWSAVDTRLTRFVAVKLLPHILVTDPSAERRFEREARAMSRLQHPNVVSIYDIGSADPGTGEELPYLVMELIGGESLDKILDNGQLEARRAARILGQVSRALGAAHAAGIVHRDLKPSNVMINESDHVKVLDFGLARLVYQDGQTPEDTLTTPGMVLGSCPYMAPEQALGQEVTPASDIFSCGAVLYEALTGARTFDGPTPMRVLQAVVRCEFTPIEELNPEAPRSLVEIVNRCLSKDPGARFANGSELSKALFGLLSKGALDPEEPTQAQPALEPAAPQQGRRPGLMLTGLVCLALIVGAGIGAGIAPFFNRTPLRPDSTAWASRTIHTTIGDLVDCDWHPDGHVIATVTSSDDQTRLMILAHDGSEHRIILDASTGETLRSPRFSPDGNTVLVASTDSSGSRVRIIAAPSGRTRAEIDNAVVGDWLDGERIAYCTDVGSGAGVRVRNLKSGEDRLVTAAPPQTRWTGLRTHPGGGIALASVGRGSTRIDVTHSIETPPATLLETSGELVGFDWSSGGESLIASIGGTLHHISEHGATRLHAGGSWYWPAFSINGTRLSVVDRRTLPGGSETDTAIGTGAALSSLVTLGGLVPERW